MSWLQPTLEDQQYVQQFQQEQPDLYTYAQVLALALQIDSRLLRNLRLKFLPRSNIELESELWFSPLMHTRNAKTATMRPAIARVLCDAFMVENPSQFKLVKAVIIKLTKHWPEASQIEQEMRWAVLEKNTQVLQHNAQRIVKAITQIKRDSEKRELARWIRNTLPILDASNEINQEHFWLFRYVIAVLGIKDKYWEKEIEPQLIPDKLTRTLSNEYHQKLGLRLRPGILEILKPGEEKAVEISIPLPTIVFFIFEMKSFSSSENEQENVQKFRIENLWPGKRIPIPPQTTAFRLITLNNEIFYCQVNANKISSKYQLKIIVFYIHGDISKANLIKEWLSNLGIQVIITHELLTPDKFNFEKRDFVSIYIWSRAAQKYWQSTESILEQALADSLLLCFEKTMLIPRDANIIDLINWDGSFFSEKSIELTKLLSSKITPVRLYVSYGNDSNKEAHFLILALEKIINICLPYIQIFYDFQKNYKDDIQGLSEEIKNSEYVILIINDKYLKSEYCMAEYIGIIEKVETSSDFIKRIYPIILNSGRKIHSKMEVAEIIEEWNEKLNILSSIITKNEKIAKQLQLNREKDFIEKSIESISSMDRILGRLVCLDKETHLKNRFSKIIWPIHERMVSEGAFRLYQTEEDLRRTLNEIVF